MSTILLVDDSESRRRQIQETVERSGLFSRVLEAREGSEAERALRGQSVDVVLCDLGTPGVGDLLQVCDTATGRGPTSFLFLSAPADLSSALQRFDHEACDVVSRTIDAADLAARLRLQIRLKRLRDEVLEKSERLEKESTIDVVTGLRSPGFMREALRVEALRAQRHRIPLSILMAELDDAGEVLERYGLVAQDAVLRYAASFVRKNLRSTDFSGRYGAGKFLVILPHTPIAGGVAVAEFWREMVAKNRVQVAEGVGIEVTISSGVADLRPTMKVPDELVKAAEEALLAGKAQGRGRVGVKGG
jgi:diguanylate cyclase (GGDEF)-like protein